MTISNHMSLSTNSLNGAWPGGVLVITETVVDAGALPVAALDHGDVGIDLVGEHRLEAVAIVVTE